MRNQMDKIKVLVVDDSILMRRIITDILEKEGDIEVVDTARNGKEALAKIAVHDPDVVTMDIEMPDMDGITALQTIMSENPRPVIMLSAADKKQADITIRALEMGAVDFIPKTSGSLSLDLEKEHSLIVQKVRTAAKIKVQHKRTIREGPTVLCSAISTCDDKIVLIGSSTGGPKALPEVISRLPGNLNAGVLIVQHMPEGFTKAFAERLNQMSAIKVKEAEEGDEIRKNIALLAPGNKHMEVRGNHIHLTDDPKVHYVRPAVDIMMKTAAPIYGNRTVGVILTGMGSDGAEGMQMIKQLGGRTVVQDEETSVVYGMPKAAVDIGAADEVVPLDIIASRIVAALKKIG
jgi:two-component system, chemotaxis family, protein-glutamate methylesterase/glutaminase